MKSQLFILGLFIVATLAQGDSESESTVKGEGFGKGRGEVWSNRRDDDLRHQRNRNTITNIMERRFTHNREWHERHQIPMPNESDGPKNGGHLNHHFSHNREWHERHGIPMPGERKHNRDHHNPNHRNSITTTRPSTTLRPSTTTVRTRSFTTTARSRPSTSTERTRPFITTVRTVPSLTTIRTRPFISTTTSTPEISREIYDTRRQVVYDDIEMINRDP